MPKIKKIVGAVLLAAVGSAHAGAPLLSEDAGVLAAGECEIELIAALARESGASERERAVGLACGAGHDWQWGVALAHAAAERGSARGLLLGGKITLWTSGEDRSIVLAPSLSWADDGSGWKHVAQDVNLVYSGPLAPDWKLHLNLGHGRDREGDERSTHGSMALEHAGFEVGGILLAPMGDLAGDDRGAPWWNLGLRLTLAADRAWLGLSYARQIDPQRARLVTLSFKYAF